MHSYCPPERADEITRIAGGAISFAGFRVDPGLESGRRRCFYRRRMMLSHQLCEGLRPMGATRGPCQPRGRLTKVRQSVPLEGLGWGRQAVVLRVREPDEALSISTPQETCRRHSRARCIFIMMRLAYEVRQLCVYHSMFLHSADLKCVHRSAQELRAGSFAGC